MTSSRTRPVLPLTVLAAVVAALMLTLSACAGSSDTASSDSGGSESAASGAGTRDGAGVERAAPQPAADDGAAYASAPSTDAVARGTAPRESDGSGQPALAPVDGRSLIKTGTVSLRSADVGAVLFDVRTIVQGAGGEISEENTEADDDGEEQRALLTVRVPTAAFDQVVDRLKNIEDSQLVDAQTATQDVTSQVVDTRVRVALQRRSIDRISVLLDRATNIGDIIAIERELARREADLGSLERRQAVLANQTSLSTITVAVDRPRREEAEPVVARPRLDEPTGFANGLADGWQAFTATTTGLLTFSGAVLPFALVLVLVGVPVWLLVRRRRPALGGTTVGAAQPAYEPAGS